MTNAFAYRGRVKAKNAFAQRAGISKHITAVNHKTYNCKITNFIAQNNNLQVKDNNLHHDTRIISWNDINKSMDLPHVHQQAH